MSDPILQTHRLSKRYRGLAAVQDVTLDFEPGLVHAIIGPNGAGKTTFLNLLSGEAKPSGGAIRFKGNDITGAASDAVSRLGIGRSFQRTNIFRALTALENCWVAAHSRETGATRWLPSRRGGRIVHERAERALAACGLAHAPDRPAISMSYGEQRQLEIAMMLATEPELMLLDEPLAGMGHDESLKMVALLQRLAGTHTLIVIEHDVDAIFAIADRIVVMVNGTVLETGTVREIRASPTVRSAYLGQEEAA